MDVGGGITPLFALDKLAVFASLLPSFTFQSGPPSYMHIIELGGLDGDSTVHA